MKHNLVNSADASQPKQQNCTGMRHRSSDDHREMFGFFLRDAHMCVSPVPVSRQLRLPGCAAVNRESGTGPSVQSPGEQAQDPRAQASQGDHFTRTR